MRRKLIDWFFWIAYIGIVIIIILSNANQFGIYEGVSFLWLLVIIVIPLLFYRLARYVFPGAFPVRKRIRPFIALKNKSSFNGSAVSKILELEMQPPIPSKEARQRFPQETKKRTFNISVAGTSIPLEFIWSKIDRWVFGPIFLIEGVVFDDENGIKIEAWSNELEARWRAKSSLFPESDLLLTAVRDLADQIRETFGLYEDLRDKYDAQHRYDLAVFYAEKTLDSYDETTLAFLYYSSGRMIEAKNEFQYLLENDKDELTQIEASRGLALVESSTGNYSKAIDILENNNKSHFDSILDKITILCYQGSFKAAINGLEMLMKNVEESISGVLGVESSELSNLSVSMLELILETLNETKWGKVYSELWILSDAYSLIGRCFEESSSWGRAEESYLSAVNVSLQLSTIHKPYHQIALDLGVRWEDLKKYNEAISYYEDCIEDAQKSYPEDPEDIYALTNICWARAGILSCIYGNLNEIYSDFIFDNPDKVSILIDNAEQLAYLFQELPMEKWHSVIFEAFRFSEQNDEQNREIIPSNEYLSEDDFKILSKILKDIVDSIGEIDLYFLLDIVTKIQQRNYSDQLAQNYFWQLAQKQEICHIAEAYFGLACIEAICGRNQSSLEFLKNAISYAPELRNRARLDTDLRNLKDEETFQQLIKWELS